MIVRSKRKRTRNARGAAMLLVLIAVAMCTIMALSFLAAQEPTAVVASNIDRKTQARAIAESALKMAIDYVNEDADWRSEKSSGVWLTDVVLDGGTFTLSGTDEDDGDLADDASQPVWLSVVASYQGVTHRVSALVTPGEEQEQTNRMLFVAGSGSSPSSDDQNKIDLFESWGYKVTVIDDSANTSSIAAAVAVHDVVYISEDCNTSSLAANYRDVTIGVVNEEGRVNDEFGFTSNSSETTDSSTSINITNNSHPITSGFPTGMLTIFTSSQDVREISGASTASGVTVLTEESGYGSDPSLMVAETGAALYHGSVLARRVMFPAGDSFDVDTLNADGKTILRRCIDWAAGGSSASGLTTKWFDLSSPPSKLDHVNWESNPDLTTIEEDIYWPSTGSSWLTGIPSDDFAVELTGTITAPTTGTWTFYLNSDDGSELVLDGSTLINNDGLHGMREYSGTHAMTAGEPAPIRVRFFERGGGAGLILSWSGPGQPKQVVPASAFASAEEEEETPGDVPTLLALYEFEQVTIAPTLAARWRLDESAPSGFGGVSTGDKIDMDGSARIQSYDSSLGDIDSQTITDNAVVTLNSTGSDDFKVDWSCHLGGDAYIGTGGNTSSVFDVNGTITGSRLVQTSNLSLPTLIAPTGMPSSSGNFKATGNSNVTINSDRRYDKFEITGSATVTISGNVTMWVEDDFDIKGSGELIIPSGSSLTLYAGDDVDIENSGRANADSTATGRFTIYAYGNKHVDVKGSGILAATVYTNDTFHMDGSGRFYGKVLANKDIKLDGSARLYQDLALGGFSSASAAMPPAEDESALENDGTYHGNPVGGKAGFGDGGTSVQFDGSDDYVEIPHDDTYLMQGGTFSVWFKTDKTTGRQGLFSKDSTGFDTGGHFSVFLDGNRIEVRMQSTTQSYFVYSPPGSISTGNWYHIMFAWGEEGMALYLDGMLVDSNDYTGGLGTTSGGIGNYEPIVLGANAWVTDDLSSNGLVDYFDGCLDDLRIYNERLSESQADEIYNGAEEPSPFQSKSIVQDTSGFGEALTLSITDTDAVTWSGGALIFDDDAVATSLVPAAKLHDAIEATGEFSIEVLLARAVPGTTSSPSRIVELSEGASDASFVLGQDGTHYEARVRDSATGTSGALSPEFVSTTDLNSSDDTHVVLSYKDGEVSVFLNGELDQTKTAGGVLNNWESHHDLLLGGTFGGGSYWHGTLKRVAIYDRGFNQKQASNVYNGQDPGDGGTTPGGVGSVRWDEED